MKYVEAINKALKESEAVLFGQMLRYGAAGLTEGLPAERMVQFPIGEAMMNAAAFGYALKGDPVVVLHDRMDFLACGMDALVNWIPVWQKIGGAPRLPVVILASVGKGHGQGPQHSKDLSPWFSMLEGWTVADPHSPAEAYEAMRGALVGDGPVLFVARRELYGATAWREIDRPEYVGFPGASQAHEDAFYGTRRAAA